MADGPETEITMHKHFTLPLLACDQVALPVHPRTGLRAVGIVAGRPVWPIRGAADDPAPPPGGQPDGGQQNGGDKPNPGPDPAGQGGQLPGQQPGQGQPQGGGDGDKKFTQADLDKKIEERLARERKKQDGADAKVTAAEKEAAEAKAAQQKLLDVIAEATGQKKSDTPPDPAALQQTLTQRENRVSELEGQNAGLRVELDAWRIAFEAGANPSRLMNSRTFHDKLGALDPKTEDRGKQIEALVKAELDADESLKAAGTPRTPRPDPSQGSGRSAPAGGGRGAAEAAKRFGKPQAAGTNNT